MKVPCDDERDFYARIADRITTNGLRVALDQPRPIGTRVAVALELRNGRTLSGEGVIDAHVRLDGMRPGVNVRFVKLERPAGSPTPTRPPAGMPGPSHDLSNLADDLADDLPDEVLDPPDPAEQGAGGASPDLVNAADPGPDEPVLSRSASGLLEQALFDEASPAHAAAAGDAQYTGSAEIFAQVRRRTVRAQRAAAVVAAVALVLAVAGYAVIRLAGGPANPDSAAAAHLQAADRLMAAGRLTGTNGALEHLLVAKQLRPADPETDVRLRHAADLLESLGARALDRGDVAVASIHLSAAKLADPGRPSIRQKMQRLERLRSTRSAR